ncbi:MAG: hypothetical protein HPY84_16725 [Syntrophobacteraceae bacterium]|jgi:hypothetical protein|nr:hypothetical protein [Syntrophobacteraceae bacterium]
MDFEGVKQAVLNLSDADKKRLIMEILPAIWPRACADDACVERVRGLVDEATVKHYKEQHMDSI